MKKKLTFDAVALDGIRFVSKSFSCLFLSLLVGWWRQTVIRLTMLREGAVRHQWSDRTHWSRYNNTENICCVCDILIQFARAAHILHNYSWSGKLNQSTMWHRWHNTTTPQAHGKTVSIPTRSSAVLESLRLSRSQFVSSIKCPG